MACHLSECKLQSSLRSVSSSSPDPGSSHDHPSLSSPASQQLRSEGRKSSRVAICTGTRTRGSPSEHVTRCVGVGVQPHRDDLLLVVRLLALGDGDHLEEGAGRPLAMTPGPRGRLVRAAGPAWTSNSLYLDRYQFEHFLKLFRLNNWHF